MSETKFGFGQRLSAAVHRFRNPETSGIKFTGWIHLKHYDKDGNLLNERMCPNGVTDVGINNNLDVAFDAATQITAWSLGLVDNAGFTAFAAGDTMASHTGWTEFTSYAEATRVLIVFEAAAAKAVSNSVTSADFNINAAGVLQGVFVASNNVKGGTTGTLWATAAFASTITVANTDLIKITYTVTGA